MIATLDRSVPLNVNYRHAVGNSAADVKSSLMGASELVIIENSRPVLYTRQPNFFCEFDGPPTRKVLIKFLLAKSPKTVCQIMYGLISTIILSLRIVKLID